MARAISRRGSSCSVPVSRDPFSTGADGLSTSSSTSEQHAEQLWKSLEAILGVAIPEPTESEDERSSDASKSMQRDRARPLPRSRIPIASHRLTPKSPPAEKSHSPSATTSKVAPRFSLPATLPDTPSLRLRSPDRTPRASRTASPVPTYIMMAGPTFRPRRVDSFSSTSTMNEASPTTSISTASDIFDRLDSALSCYSQDSDESEAETDLESVLEFPLPPRKAV